MEQRRYPRLARTMRVQYRFETVDDFFNEYSADLSIGGMFIRTVEPRPLNSLLYLQFALEGGRRLVEGLARVVHVNEPGGDRPAGMGIEFVNFDPESQAFIQEMIHRRMGLQGS